MIVSFFARKRVCGLQHCIYHNVVLSSVQRRTNSFGKATFVTHPEASSSTLTQTEGTRFIPMDCTVAPSRRRFLPSAAKPTMVRQELYAETRQRGELERMQQLQMSFSSCPWGKQTTICGNIATTTTQRVFIRILCRDSCHHASII